MFMFNDEFVSGYIESFTALEISRNKYACLEYFEMVTGEKVRFCDIDEVAALIRNSNKIDDRRKVTIEHATGWVLVLPKVKSPWYKSALSFFKRRPAYSGRGGIAPAPDGYGSAQRCNDEFESKDEPLDYSIHGYMRMLNAMETGITGRSRLRTLLINVMKVFRPELVRKGNEALLGFQHAVLANDTAAVVESLRSQNISLERRLAGKEVEHKEQQDTIDALRTMVDELKSLVREQSQQIEALVAANEFRNGPRASRAGARMFGGQ